ncbi:MAG: hypothetical protein ACPIOQ_39145 [Promethearchaeia archaeon]
MPEHLACFWQEQLDQCWAVAASARAEQQVRAVAPEADAALEAGPELSQKHRVALLSQLVARPRFRPGRKVMCPAARGL